MSLYPVIVDSVHTVTGTTITGATTAALAMSLRTHMAARERESEVELWYWREAAWKLFPVQPIKGIGSPITLSYAYRQPSQMTFSLPDRDGLLTPQNLNSSYNYLADGVTQDPLIDSQRKVLLRAGVRCFTSLANGIAPTSTLAPASGALSLLTNAAVGDIASSTAGYVQFSPASSATFDIVVDLGSAKEVRHLVIRFATKKSTCTLPRSVTFGWSPDNVTWYDLPARPVGGTGGDWDEDGGTIPRNVEVPRTDLGVTGARYIRFRITPTGAQTIFIDELAVYGGSSVGYVGGNKFVGYLGSGAKVNAKGVIPITAVGTLKKAIRNNSARLTAQFGNPPVECADIIYTLLTGAAYWKGTRYAGADLGWTSGSNATGFKWPIWQGLKNNIYGYVQELLHSIGWDIYEDYNGVLQLREPPYRQMLPDRVFIADPDGCGDVWGIERDLDDVDMRNVVTVRSGDSNSGATATVKIQPNSIARYEELETDIEDPIAMDQTTREKIASYVLRDYAWRLWKLRALVHPDWDTHIKGVYGFRASQRPKIYPKASTQAGALRLGELWTVETIQETIAAGEWNAEVNCVQYVAQGPGSPIGLTATPHTGVPTQIDLAWTTPGDLDITDYGIYISTTGETSGFQKTPNYRVGGTTTSYAVTGLTNGVQYWFFVTAIGQNGMESVPSSVVTAKAGSAAGDESKWTITDLAVTLNASSPPANSDGRYEYEFYFTWTSPPVGANAFDQANYGTKQFNIGMAIDAAPSNPSDPHSWYIGGGPFEWHGDRVPSLLKWDKSTVGNLDWYLRTSFPGNLSGHTVYFVFFTWQNTHGRGGPAHQSNVISIAIP